ncbi:MAG TPA: septal ring lytic transglycosylase RlpA family protein [Bryobacteraceae bacterium]|nr:septal ring lytic transglycosylase RlpA family protein [Bryobacteraceae bacterium]
MAPPVTPRPGDTQEGIASWYGDPYHGRRAANGEIYDMEDFTAAHRTWAFDTLVRVTNLSNRKEVEVRITDRGPFVQDRIIDLSRAAAREIGMIGAGTAKVRLRVLSSSSRFAVQAGAFADREKAEQLCRRLETKFGGSRIVMRSGTPVIYRVLVGSALTRERAVQLAGRVRKECGEGIAIRVDGP